MARTTFSVARLLHKVNMLNRIQREDVEARHARNVLLESILHETGNYAGYGYLEPTQLPTGVKPGINAGDRDTMTLEDKFNGTDETRRFYFISERLRAEYEQEVDRSSRQILTV